MRHQQAQRHGVDNEPEGSDLHRDPGVGAADPTPATIEADSADQAWGKALID